MQDVIRELIKTEGEAKRMVDEARQQAEKLVESAQKQAQGTLARARTEARQQAEKLVESAVEQGRAAKQQALAEAALEIQAKLQLDPAIRDQIVAAVVQCVCGNVSPVAATAGEAADRNCSA